MKKLIFVRHGKAEDPASGISDYERSLTTEREDHFQADGKKTKGD